MPKRHFLIFTLLTLLAGLWPIDTSFGNIEAVTKAYRDKMLSFSTRGVVGSEPIAIGTQVKQGEILMQLEGKVTEAEMKRLKLRASSDVPVRAAQEQLNMANVQIKRVVELHAKGVASQLELMEAQVNANIAQLRLEQAKLDMQVAHLEYQVALERHEETILRAPADGQVEMVLEDERVRGKAVTQGEAVAELQPVLRLVMDEVLIVDTPVPTGQAMTLTLGSKAYIRAQMTGRQRNVVGHITYIETISSPESRTKRVRIIVPNQDHYLGAGWHVTVSLNGPMADKPTRVEELTLFDQIDGEQTQSADQESH